MTCVIKLPTCDVKRMQAWAFLLVKHVVWACLSWTCFNIYWVVCLLTHAATRERSVRYSSVAAQLFFFAFKCSGWKVRFIVLSCTPIEHTSEGDRQRHHSQLKDFIKTTQKLFKTAVIHAQKPWQRMTVGDLKATLVTCLPKSLSFCQTEQLINNWHSH